MLAMCSTPDGIEAVITANSSFAWQPTHQCSTPDGIEAVITHRLHGFALIGGVLNA